MSLTLAVPEAAAFLGVSERTIWRWIQDGRLAVLREGRRVRVVLDRGETDRRVAEVEAAYDVDGIGVHRVSAAPWPFTSEGTARHRERLRRQRAAALRRLEDIAHRVRPDPDGLTGVDYLREIRDP